MYFMGDIHGNYEPIKNFLIEKNHDIPLIQIGDYGVGFREWPKNIDDELLKNDVYFFRGNHDNPHQCQFIKNYLGDYGYFQSNYGSFYYLSGGLSIDYHKRISGVDWWEDEELSYRQFLDAFDDYSKIKPNIMVTHDIPTYLLMHMSSAIKIQSRTQSALDMFFNEHQPKLWIFGHFHMSFEYLIGSTKFVCLNINETRFFDLNNI